MSAPPFTAEILRNARIQLRPKRLIAAVVICAAISFSAVAYFFYAPWRTFIEAQHMDWSEYIDLSGTVLKAFEVDSFPTYVLLDKDGVIRFRQSGFGDMTRGELEEAINKTLKRAPDPKLAALTATPPAGATLAPVAGIAAGPPQARN